MNALTLLRWLQWLGASRVRTTAFISVCLALMLGLAYGLHLRAQFLAIERVAEQVQGLHIEQADKSAQAQALAIHEVQLAAVQHALGTQRWGLAAGGELADLLEDVERQGQASAVVIEHLELLTEVLHEQYIEQPLQIQVRGTYIELAAFAHGLAGLPRLITQQDFSLLPVPEQPMSGLRMQVQFSAYRSRVAGVGSFSATEVAEQEQPVLTLSGNPFEASPQVQHRQYLETLALDQFEMIGSLARRQVHFALLQVAGVVHRLQVGDRLGRDQGRIVSIDERQVEIAEEIFVAGKGWVERRRSLSLKLAADAG